MCTNALTTTKNTTHVISNKDTTEHELLLCKLNNPLSTQTMKHLRLILTCVPAAKPVQESQQQMS
eukprot:15066287-Ditylum_brightwellii.AAC.1